MGESRSGLWQQLRALVRPPGAEGEEDAQGLLAPRARALHGPLVANMLAAVDRRAGDIAVPRSDMVTVGQDSPLTRVVEVFREAGHSRIPVHGASLDEIAGMLHVKDIYALLTEGRPQPDAPFPISLVRPVLFVPTSMPVLQLLAEMRRQRTHMAIVVDEFGGTDGLATIEDVVEQIVGEIEDEHDEEAPPLLAATAPGLWEADARLPLAEADRTLGTRFAETGEGGDVETLGGLVTMMAGSVPPAGTTLLHPQGWRLSVLEADGRRVTRVRLEPPDLSMLNDRSAESPDPSPH